MKYLAFIRILLAIFMCLLIVPSVNPVSAAETEVNLNGKIAFMSDRDGNWEIYVMNADGSEQTRLTNNNAYDGVGSWSPDGTKIAFSSDRDGNEDIYIMNSDGSGQTRLTNSNSNWDPTWSPDGTKIIFTTNRDGNEEIYVINADGSGLTRLTNNNYKDSDTSWSPDGTKITFESDRDGNWEIYVMNTDGSGQTRLTNNNARDEDPIWSPDGNKIIFASYRDGNGEVYVMNTDGSEQSRLTNDNADDQDPSWSPDGNKIAFNTNRDGNYELYVMNNDGSEQSRLTNNNASDRSPYWQRLYITSFQQTGIGSDFSGNVLTVDSISYTANQLPVLLPWSTGTSHDFSWASPLAVSVDKRYAWSSSSGLSTEKSGTLIATSEGDSIAANYIEQCYVRFEVSSGGSIAQSSDWYRVSSSASISATPSTGYSFSNWAAIGSVSVTDAVSKNTTLTINGPGTVTANFTVDTFTISASAASGGSISPSGSVVVNYGESQTFTITPNTGYDIADVLIDGTSGGAVGSYTFNDVVSNHTIVAHFTLSETAPDSTTPSTTSDSEPTNWGLIVGIIIAVLVVFIVLFVLWRKRKSGE